MTVSSTAQVGRFRKFNGFANDCPLMWHEAVTGPWAHLACDVLGAHPSHRHGRPALLPGRCWFLPGSNH